MNKIWFSNTLLFSSVLASILFASPKVARSNDFTVPETLANTAPCRLNVTGAYLTTIFNPDNSVASRGVITLTADGNFFVTDSNQGGVPNAFNPFTSGQGAWKCNSKTKVSARSITFAFPGSAGAGSIGRADYQATFNPQTQTVQGTITLRLFNVSANPLSNNVPPLGTFNFSGQKIKPN
ncbi:MULTISPECIES: hypothetical protein [Nostoc]|uniref:Uncharacterized protein n=1 Tax=Nostoc paludosum FACHB-159 TaxID=2692908 RepID=A0ABR8K2U6_9NOSO|nr:MULTISPECIES: hypothetical protein [Nostoc]MBD2676290.1 hypothetical protein [Nostoc sp. FACHB-857]MBD2732582.1 hypothetical protein [Nostoc paludosum FACHB-159]